MENEQKKPGWLFMAQWLGVCIAGPWVMLFGGVVVQFVFRKSILSHLRGPDFPSEIDWLIQNWIHLLAGGAAWALMAMLQWLVFRQFLPQMRMGPWVAWSCIFFVLWYELTLNNLMFLFFYLNFLLIGFGQWIVLRKHLSKAAWWIPAYGLAYNLGIFVAEQVHFDKLGMLSEALCFSVTFGLITGPVMLWLLRTNTIEPEMAVGEAEEITDGEAAG